MADVADPGGPLAAALDADALDDRILVRLVARVGVEPSILSTTSMPEVTSPKTVCLPSSHGASGVVTMKNCDPLVSGPALAMASAPRTILWSLNSSSNV